MRVFLTGATGFLGSHLLGLLLDRGHDVAVLLRPDSKPWRIDALLPRVTKLHGSLANPDVLEQSLTTFGTETVMHLGWHGVGNADRNSEVQSENLAEARALLDLSVRLGVRTWIGLGSQAEYGPCPAVIGESQPCAPTTLYGKIKLETCWLAQNVCAAKGMRFAWLRLFSSYGPGDHEYWMIPYLILSLLRRERPALTAGEQMWDYLYAGDVATAALAIAETGNAKGIYNLGSGQAYPLRRIIETIRDLIDTSLPLGLGEIPYRPDQVMHLQADISRLRTVTDWAPRTDLDDGLRRTVESYREHKSRDNR